jgi:hypothetical protein
MELALEGKDELSEFKSDLAASPTWQAASASLRERLLAGSIKYLREADPSPERWFGENRFHRPAAAGYRSLRLLREEAPERLVEIENDLWSRWAPIIVAYPAYGGSEGTAQKALVATAYEHAPEALRDWLRRTIEYEDSKNQEPFVLRRFGDVWDADLEAALAEIVTVGGLTPRGTAAVLGFMLAHGSSGSTELARSLLPLPPPQKTEERELALCVARLLLARVEGAFQLVWQAVESDVDFGRALISRLAHRDEDEGGTVAHLREDELAEVFIWTERYFPRAEDPDMMEGGFLGERESIARWRDSLLNQLETRGSEAGCRALQRVSATFPELAWLRRVLARAEQRALAESWVRPTPRELLALAADSDRRFVASGRQLVEVIVESLERAQGKLTGQTPQASWLWNILPDGSARPREEGDLSDWLKTHLQGDLLDRRIIVNREVEIRRAPGAGIGDRTDIHIDAIGQADGGPDRHVRAVIEVKGCWNDELESALRTQLLDSYLLGAGSRFGVYVVGWFESERWDTGDRRRSRCEGHSRANTQGKLIEEASALSHEHDVLIRVQPLHVPLRARRRRR